VKSSVGAAAAVAAGGPVFLVGFMGAGKTSVGRALGRRLNWIFEDLDDRIERREGRTVADMFRESGEAAFREAESAALQQVLEEAGSGVVRIVALGGGAFVQPANAAMLKATGVPIAFLDAPVEELWQRCRKQAGAAGVERPLLRSQEDFRKLYAVRRKRYLRATRRIDTGGRSIDAIAAEIARTLGLKAIVTRSEQGESE